LVCGDNEVKENLITYRKYGSNATSTVTIKEFVEMIKQEIKTMGR
jgi:threonyl-tRNA synthetase